MSDNSRDWRPRRPPPIKCSCGTFNEDDPELATCWHCGAVLQPARQSFQQDSSDDERGDEAPDHAAAYPVLESPHADTA